MNTLLNEETFIKAIADFQNFAGLPVTGDINFTVLFVVKISKFNYNLLSEELLVKLFKLLCF